MTSSEPAAPRLTRTAVIGPRFKSSLAAASASSSVPACSPALDVRTNPSWSTNCQPPEDVYNSREERRNIQYILYITMIFTWLLLNVSLNDNKIGKTQGVAPVRLCSSVSLGDTMSTSASSRGDSCPSAPPQSSTAVAPAASCSVAGLPPSVNRTQTHPYGRLSHGLSRHTHCGAPRGRPHVRRNLRHSTRSVTLQGGTCCMEMRRWVNLRSTNVDVFGDLTLHQQHGCALQHLRPPR